MVFHLSAMSSTVRLYGRVVILVRPPWLILGASGICDCVEYGSSIMSAPLVSPSKSLVPNSQTDVDNFLEKVTLYCPTVGDLCPKDGNLISRLASLLVP